jgi:hypothetical protein
MHNYFLKYCIFSWFFLVNWKISRTFAAAFCEMRRTIMHYALCIMH